MTGRAGRTAAALRALARTALGRLGRPARSDLTAGLVTGLFSIPEGMAYASIAGFNPVAGLYAGMLPPVIGALATPTVLMVTTLTSAIALTSQGVLTEAGLDPHATGNIAALAVLSGAMMVLMGVLRLGVVLSFVSNAVLTGFSLGIALQIITGVLRDASGYRPPGHNKLYQVGSWLYGADQWHVPSAVVAGTTIGVWALAYTVRRLRPLALLIAMVAVSCAVAALGTDVPLVGQIAHVPDGLPGFSAPDPAAVPHLLGGALAVALVALAQAAGIAPALPNPDGSRSSVNTEFAAQGLANLAGGLFHALPVSGSLSRTAISASAGARTRWAALASGVFLTLLVILFGSLAEHIPLPVIGGLILVIGAELIWSRRAEIMLVVRTSYLSAVAMVGTFAATTQYPLQQAIVLGAVLSLLLYCIQASRQAGFSVLTLDRDGRWTADDRIPERLPPGRVTVLAYEGTSFFAELPHLRHRLPDTAGAHGSVLVLVLRSAPDIPSSAILKALARYHDRLRQEGGRLLLAGVRPALAALLERTGLDERIGPDAVFPVEPQLLAPLDRARAAGEAWIAARGAAPPGDQG
ncbi:SulP family inorganic anion transporter [Kitasatospora sp. NPDC059571]|uniref:SulP family inorganic anion transporter n=1 Tax=Kitasatospora sp. NPDC059571 TaxID=3346871 RepID=UPI00368212AF